MIIFFIRHGETTGDVENRYGGTYDDDLSPCGQVQARELAEVMRGKGIEGIYVSPLIRAQETAAVLADAIGCSVETMADLRERNQYSFLSGMEKGGAAQKNPMEVELLKNRLNTIEGAETYEDFAARIGGAFAAIANDIRHETVAIVTHGGPMRVLFRDVLKRGELSEIGDCSWVELRVKDGEYVVVDSAGVILREAV